MIKACFLIKYPPIEGGVSMHSYWMARGLAERGHQIFVVTNAREVENDYRMYMNEEDGEWYEPHFKDSGGFVKVLPTRSVGDMIMHIPQSNPFVSKLSSIATDTVRENNCDVIFAYYLEPYGMAAYLASQWTDVPYMVRHAGSDLGRLMKQPDLTTAYREVFKRADSVWTAIDKKDSFLAIGVKEEALWLKRLSQQVPILTPDAPPLDLNGLLASLSEADDEHVRNILINRAPIDSSKPTIGIYGKVGLVKGSFDLLKALSHLKRSGLEFNFIALTQGGSLSAFKSAIEELDLRDRTWLFPFLPHWRIPGFIRSCTAVCFLERDFPISFHGPTVPGEVMKCGTCLVLSREIAEKQGPMRSDLVNGKNVLLVNDPVKYEDLAAQLKLAIEDPAKARSIGLEGRKLIVEASEREIPKLRAHESHIQLLEEHLLELSEKRRSRPSKSDTRDISTEKRQSALEACLPCTRRVLDGRWDQTVAQYLTKAPTAGGRYNDALGFCDFLASELAAELTNGSYLCDILKYERARCLLYAELPFKSTNNGKVRPGSAVDRPAPMNGSKRLSPRGSMFETWSLEQILQIKPIKARGVFIEEFGHDIGQLKLSLKRRMPPKIVPHSQSFILFKKEPNFVGEELQINEPLKFLIDKCDGKHTLESIAAELTHLHFADQPKALSRDEIEKDVVRMTRGLASKGIVFAFAPK